MLTVMGIKAMELSDGDDQIKISQGRHDPDFMHPTKPRPGVRQPELGNLPSKQAIQQHAMDASAS